MKAKIERFLRLCDHFAVVGDVMCQYQSDIGSLAWGGCRLVIKLALNDFDTMGIIMDHLEQIFLILGRVELYSTLVNSQRIQEGVVKLYTFILEFVQKATTFLGKRGFGRVTRAIWRPYHLEFQGTYQKIKDYVDHVEREANAANMVTLQKQNMELQQQLKNITELLSSQSSSIGLMAFQMTQPQPNPFSAANMMGEFRYGECQTLARKLTTYITAIDFIDNAPLVLTTSRKYLPTNACNWILSSPLFLKWMHESDPKFLAIIGGRNTGKFVLASFITTTLLDDPVIGKNVIWFHSVLWEEEPVTPSSMIRFFIAQLLRNRPDILMRRSSSFHKKRFKAAKALKDLFTLFSELVALAGKTYLMIDALDSCPNNGLMVDNLLRLTESGINIKIVITAMNDPVLGPILQDVDKIVLETDSVSCDISSYVMNQLTNNFPSVLDAHPNLAISIITGAGGSIGWARYIIWGIAQCKDEEGIKKWQKIAVKGRDVAYARKFDAVSASVDSRTLVLHKTCTQSIAVAG
jgi:hypothetical protein